MEDNLDEEARASQSGSTSTPQGGAKSAFDPKGTLAKAEDRASEYLNNRSRVIAGAIVVVVWGLLAGESKSTIPLTHEWKVGLLAAAALSVTALILDYFQYLVEYLFVTWEGGRLLGLWGRRMFKAKQLFTLLSVATFAAVSTLVLLQAIRTEAQARVEFAIYKGSVWSSAAPGQKKASTLYLRPANPVTGSTQATEDDVACTGSQQGQRVILLCDGIRFDGLIDGRFYKGQWMPTSTSQEGGGFEYKFIKNFTKQP